MGLRQEAGPRMSALTLLSGMLIGIGTAAVVAVAFLWWASQGFD